MIEVLAGTLTSLPSIESVTTDSEVRRGVPKSISLIIVMTQSPVTVRRRL
jgi:hypothetical protein